MPMQKTHTADEATLYGETQVQDSANVSSAKFNNLIIYNLLCDYYFKLFNQQPPHLLQEQIIIPATQKTSFDNA